MNPESHDAGRIVCEILDVLEAAVAPGITTWELEQLAEAQIYKKGAKPAFKGYLNFPCCLCASINEEVVHGIPSKKRKLQEGDLMKLDFGVVFRGYYGDSARTVPVGKVSVESSKLIEATRDSLLKGIEQSRPGNRLGDIGHAVQQHVESFGFSVVRDFVGHGIGRRFHEDPQVKHYGRRNSGDRLKAGMIFTIEPMVNLGRFEVVIDPVDKWTVTTADGSLSAQFEHTCLVTKSGVEILTKRPKPLRLSENVATILA